ncbi:ATP-binding protein [Texcoconibacillus texcoconensis]|uniref:ATP-binding protein n=1 Tax=Texcoconibacillus texcoconensis TaxID=1095777 RepID=UPI0016168862
MFGLEELLLNVLFLIVFLLFVPLLLEVHANAFFQKNKKSIFTISMVLAIIACISFPIPILEGYIFDLRLVALTIGGLYGGIPTALLLASVTALYRVLLGGPGVPVALVALFTLIILMFIFNRRFHDGSRKKKVIIGATLSFLSTFAMIVAIIIFQTPFDPMLLFLHLFITTVAAILIIYLYEVIHEHIIVSKRVMRAEKMEVVSHLASSISHEVRNPLTTVRGFMQMMLHADLPEHKRNQYLTTSIDEVDRATEIIRDYLTFAKPSPENEETLNLKQELERTLQIITPLANMNGVKVETNLEDVYIKGEEQFLQQCLVNITKNCIEAMPEKGKLSIVTKTERDKVLLKISDNGKGMTEDQLLRLGEPYFTTKGREGTGLGMMVSMKIIESMNGKLNVTSRLNEGTRFLIELPIVEENG